jgi:hypothetical protein
LKSKAPVGSATAALRSLTRPPPCRKPRLTSSGPSSRSRMATTSSCGGRTNPRCARSKFGTPPGDLTTSTGPPVGRRPRFFTGV